MSCRGRHTEQHVQVSLRYAILSSYKEPRTIILVLVQRFKLSFSKFGGLCIQTDLSFMGGVYSVVVEVGKICKGRDGAT